MSHLKIPLVAALLVSCLGLPRAEAAGVEVHISLLQSGKIDLAYQLPPGCQVLPLRDGPWTLKQQRAWRGQWQAMDDCGALSDHGLSRSNPACKAMRFSVPVGADGQERQAAPAYAIGQQGIYLHTASFAPDTSCGPVTWRFAAPNGAVVVDGMARGTAFSMPESSAPTLRTTAVYFSRLPIDNGAEAITVFAPEVPGWLRSGLGEASAGIVQHYRQTFPQIAFPLPMLAVSNARDDQGPRLAADVSHARMMRFAFANAGDDLDVKRLQAARGTLAHEYAHVLQSGLRSEAYLHPERTVLAEGGAEFLRWISEYRLGWKNGAVLGEELDEALNLCLMAIGDQPWQRALKRNAGRTPYQCGLAIHVLTLAARSSPYKAETVLGNFYAAVKRDPKADIGMAIDCDNVPGCRARILPDLLGSKAGFASQMGGLLHSLGVIRKNDVQPTPQTKLFYANAAFSQLMTEDCSGLGYWTRDGYFEVGGLDSCKSLQRGMKISHAENINLFGQSQLAAEAIADACEKHGRTLLRTVDAQEVQVACRYPYRPAKNFYKLDTSRILTLLDGR